MISDFLGNWKPKCFHNSIEFLKEDLESYDLILIDHSIEPNGWENVYLSTKDKTKASYGIMSTYSQEYYQLEEPEKVTLTDKVIRDPRISGIFKKCDTDKILKWVDREKDYKETFLLVSKIF